MDGESFWGVSREFAGAVRIRLDLFEDEARADRSDADTPAPPSVSLTSREREVVELIDEGCSNKQIARTLSIEVATVKHHVHNLLAKLKVSRRGEAAARFRGYLLHDPNHS